MLRSHKLDEVNENLVGQEVVLCGWISNIRKLGKMVFLDLRDRYGLVQAIVKEDNSNFESAVNLSRESCVSLKGKIVERKTPNSDLPSGKVELIVNELKIFSPAERLPFEISTANEEVRLKYRYLDIRMNEKLKKNLILRHKIINFIRNYLDEKGFLEISTPILTKSSPEGARDFIVPSRLHPGKFYALPQAPQQYKQLLMVAGVDKYFQIAPCFRDEDPRADRSPGEFYQLDLEMSFGEQKDILNLIENLFTEMIKKLLPEKKFTFDRFKVLTYEEAMKNYGSDKPDLRKDKNDPNELAFCWVVDFPLFEEEMENGNYAPKHHMFTMPKEEDLINLNKENAEKVKSYQHDLVLNGFEVGGGSMRIHDPKIQSKIFELIGFSEEQKEYFNHMLTAFSFGPPPHGGIAPGIDRLIMVLLGEENLREVIAFPKNKEAKDLVMGAPSFIDKSQLEEVGLEVNKNKNN